MSSLLLLMPHFRGDFEQACVCWGSRGCRGRDDAGPEFGNCIWLLASG